MMLKDIFKKNREVILYLVFGVLTTVVNIAIFEFCVRAFQIEALIANAIAWVGAVAFAYFTNRNIVFEKTNASVLSEAIKFVVGRIGTLAMEEGLLWLMIYAIGVNASISKIIAQCFVVVGNYVISKLFVFRKKGEEET